MKVADPSTGASEAIPYASFGASFFMGTEKVTSKTGYWTGLMTEWYHAAPYYGNESVVTYESKIDKVQFVNFEIEEFVEGNPSIFEVRTPAPVNLFNYTSTGVSFKYFNATIEWHPYYFTTG